MKTDRLPSVICAGDERRELVRHSPDLNGIDYVEVADDGTSLTVVLLHKLGDLRIGIHNVRVEPSEGRPGRHVAAVGVTLCKLDDPKRDDCLQVSLDCPLDDGPYTVCLVQGHDGAASEEPLHGFDRFYACAGFRVIAKDPSDLDCAVETPCDVPAQHVPPIDYLARDYASLRQLIFDRLATTLPDWRERHVPDLGVTLVELLAYAGDRLSYFQDAVATEAYLETARRRVSVRRHARLVDYRLHEGTNARAFLVVTTDAELTLAVDDVFFITGSPLLPGPARPLNEDDLRGIPVDYEVFEPLVATGVRELVFHPGLDHIEVYTWGSEECCLPKGTTRATLVDRDGSLGALRGGQWLILEEVIGPRTGNPADADPGHRHPVLLAHRPRRVSDPLAPDVRLVEIEWAAEDALPFDLCLSVRGPAPECRVTRGISVVRGNVVLVDHGRTLPPEPIGRVAFGDSPTDCAPGCGCCASAPRCDCQCAGCPPERVRDGKPFHPTLSRRPLVHAERLRVDSAARVFRRDAAAALPEVTLTALALDGAGPELEAADWAYLVDLADRLVRRQPGTITGPETVVTTDDWTRWQTDALPLVLPAGLRARVAAAGAPPEDVDLRRLERQVRRLLRRWEPRYDLLESDPADQHFVVETEEDGRAMLRFGDGDLGCQPAAGTAFAARYRIGGGPAGNVGVDTICHLVTRRTVLDGLRLTVRNPLPAAGGAPRESTDHAKAFAPHAFRGVLARAITAADYGALVARDFASSVQGASGSLVWMGSWYEVAVGVDERGRDEATPELCREVAGGLQRYRRMGHDLAVTPAVLVPLDIVLKVCARPHALNAHVKVALMEAFSNRRLAGGRRGFFHPDELTLGGSVFLSQLVARAMAVDGVESATVITLRRLARHATDDLGGPATDALEQGVLRVGPLEVARVDNDPRRPGHGQITFNVHGGR